MGSTTESFETPLIGDAINLDRLAKQAATASRKRSHLLLHSGPDDPVQRLLIAAQPGTYVRPHKHSQQWEMLVLLQGRVDLLLFRGTGELLSCETLTSTTPVAQIPIAKWRSCLVREPDTLLLEIKPGPYRPNEFADWAPEEHDEQAPKLVNWMGVAMPGDKWLREQDGAIDSNGLR